MYPLFLRTNLWSASPYHCTWKIKKRPYRFIALILLDKITEHGKIPYTSARTLNTQAINHAKPLVLNESEKMQFKPMSGSILRRCPLEKGNGQYLW